MEKENIYSTPKAELEDESSISSEPIYFPVSQKKLEIMYLLTMGLYGVYWFYKNWKIKKENFGWKVFPTLRAIFCIFFTHELFRDIKRNANEHDIQMSWQHPGLATKFICFLILNNLTSTLGIIFLILSIKPLKTVQGTINQIIGDEEGELNSSFSVGNYLFGAFGVLMWISTFAEIFVKIKGL